jgi:hypothetical protein
MEAFFMNMKIDIGISEANRKDIAGGLAKLLAQLYPLLKNPQLPLERPRSDVSDTASDV